jgi:glycosyltransferase involved in cell wall biosynthesis
MKLPKITIVTPSFNQAKYLPEAIESILTQNYPNLEYIIIDGASTDGSVDIIKKYESRLSHWVSEKDKGQSDAIMKGFARSSGELFAWVNSDDILLPGCLQRIAEQYVQSGYPDILTGNVIYLDEEGRITRYIRLPRQSRFFFFRGVWHVSAPAIFFKASLFRSVGGVNLDYHLCMDFDLWMKMMVKDARVVHIPCLLGGYRWHPETKTMRYLANSTSRVPPEREQVYRENIRGYVEWQVLFWKRIYKLYQLLNLNYLRGYIECLIAILG